jgi:hypothetical protein
VWFENGRGLIAAYGETTFAHMGDLIHYLVQCLTNMQSSVLGSAFVSRHFSVQMPSFVRLSKLSIRYIGLYEQMCSDLYVTTAVTMSLDKDQRCARII